ncbi:MAG: Ig-like domain-containing protein, partial [Acidobacteriota bacterium]
MSFAEQRNSLHRPRRLAWSVALTLAAVCTGLSVGTNSSAVSVSSNQGLTVTLTSPAAGRIRLGETVALRAVANAPAGLSKVEFYADQFRIGEAVRAPIQAFWKPITPGSYNLRARAIDVTGAVADSTLVNLQVVIPPQVRIVSPTDNAAINLNTIAILAEASDEDGTVRQVDFSVDGATLGRGIVTRFGDRDLYQLSWPRPPAGANWTARVAVHSTTEQTVSQSILIV